MSEGFHVVLPSNSSRSIYPNNTLNDYTVQLVRPLEFNQNWLVAATEVTFPKSFQNITKDIKFVLKSFQKDHRTKTVAISVLRDAQNNVPTGKVMAGHYTSQSLIKKLNEAVTSIWNNKPQVKNMPQYPTPRFDYDDLTRKVTWVTPTNAMVGGSKAKYFINFQDNNTFYDLMGYDGSVESFISKLNVEPTYQVVADREFDVFSGENMLYVYTDITQPIIVGDSKVNLLRSVPLLKDEFTALDSNASTTDRFTQYYYIPVALKRIETITVSIRDQLGRAIHFSPGIVQLTLHFKKI
jgi:hypothetical protein